MFLSLQLGYVDVFDLWIIIWLLNIIIKERFIKAIPFVAIVVFVFNVINTINFIFYIGCVIYVIYANIKKCTIKIKTINNTILDIICWIIICFIVILPIILIVPKFEVFLLNGIISVLQSFGGGSSYLIVAKSAFVDSKIVSFDYYYNTIIPIINMIPGSILCKVLSAIGYAVVNNNMQLEIIKIMGAWAGLIISVSISSLVCVFVHRSHIYSINKINTNNTYIDLGIAAILLNLSISIIQNGICRF